jgi:hypothetical protein
MSKREYTTQVKQAKTSIGHKMTMKTRIRKDIALGLGNREEKCKESLSNNYILTNLIKLVPIIKGLQCKRIGGKCTPPPRSPNNRGIKFPHLSITIKSKTIVVMHL